MPRQRSAGPRTAPIRKFLAPRGVDPLPSVPTLQAMIAKERPAADPPRPEPTPPPIVVEDRSDEDFQQDLREAIFMREWVKQQRAAGHPPN